MTSRIEDLEGMQIIGNAHDDRVLFDAAHRIIADASEPVSVRYRAIKMLDRAMGQETPKAEEATEATMLRAIAEYLELTDE